MNSSVGQSLGMAERLCVDQAERYQKTRKVAAALGDQWSHQPLDGQRLAVVVVSWTCGISDGWKEDN